LYRIDSARGDAVGVMYGAEGLPLDLIAARLPVSRPFALRLAHALAPALIVTTAYLPGSFSDNTLRVHSTGTPTITIEGRQTDEANAGMRRVIASLRREMRSLGAMFLPGSLSLLQPGADAHYAGTLPMGADGPIATGEYGEVRNCPGLFVADGACLPSLPATHPTLTIMANADRIGGEIARRLHSQAEVHALRQAS
jgi:choline dehydrogenase-like flavoprotein